jgi:hypothetical protein
MFTAGRINQMKCRKCKSQLPVKAEFCPKCGQRVQSDGSLINVQQKADDVKGRVVGAVISDDGSLSNLQSTTSQNVSSIEEGGTVIGTILGKGAQVDDHRHYGDVIRVGNVSDSTNVTIGKGNETSTGTSAEEIAKAFSLLLQAVNEMPESPEQTMAVTAIQNLEVEARKGENADESNVHKWFSFLAEMAPDIYEVAVNSFSNPILGLSTVFKKVAERGRHNK